MKFLIVQKNGYFKYRRRIPTELVAVIGKKEVSESLRTKDRTKAASLYAEVDRRWNAIIESYRLNPNMNPKDRLAALQAITDGLGVPYVSVASKATLSDQEKIDDAYRVAELYKDLGEPSGDVLAAITGDESDESTISDFFDFYLEEETQKKLNLNDKEYKNKINPLRLWMERFIEAHGDLTANQITPTIVNEFKRSIQAKIDDGEMVKETAYKAGVSLRKIFQVKIDSLELEISNPFKNLKFDRGTAKRQTIRREQIEDVLLSDGYLDGLNDQARALLLIMINTGCGPKEVIGLTQDTIKLSDNIPHIIIEPNEIRGLKTDHRTRMIPLLGVSLEAARNFPDGFSRYANHRGPDALSACLNKYLKGKGFFEGKQAVYSLRHGFKDRMRKANFNDSMMDELMGHKTAGPKYGDGYYLEQLAEKLEPVALK